MISISGCVPGYGQGVTEMGTGDGLDREVCRVWDVHSTDSIRDTQWGSAQ